MLLLLYMTCSEQYAIAPLKVHPLISCASYKQVKTVMPLHSASMLTRTPTLTHRPPLLLSCVLFFPFILHLPEYGITKGFWLIFSPKSSVLVHNCSNFRQKLCIASLYLLMLLVIHSCVFGLLLGLFSLRSRC